MSRRAGEGLGAQSAPSSCSLQTSMLGPQSLPITSRGPVREDRNPVPLPVTTAVTMAVESRGEGKGHPSPATTQVLWIRATFLCFH